MILVKMKYFHAQPIDESEEEDRKKLLDRMERDREMLDMLDEVNTKKGVN